MVVVVMMVVVVVVIMVVGDLTKSNKNVIPPGGMVRVVLTSIFRETSTTRCLDSAAPLLLIRSHLLPWVHYLRFLHWRLHGKSCIVLVTREMTLRPLREM